MNKGASRRLRVRRGSGPVQQPPGRVVLDTLQRAAVFAAQRVPRHHNAKKGSAVRTQCGGPNPISVEEGSGGGGRPGIAA